ncbi:hypothetical protein [Legionella londiniensis]|uniref:Uncharacterized protein n=1 Tax=Legionella londiniensis TaxID=45068 RepID=A0A0W0VRZ7_9GAMM|nr:hypothetical protein [Legionella londiniensis]KTD22972.1 hypothetical protein Llon_0362 [Legionella londiniensis]STX92920.1 Uncharacterised protein [Legionella londiniensis]
MPHNQAVYEALNNLQLSDEKEKAQQQYAALSSLFYPGKGTENFGELKEKFVEALNEHREILGLKDKLPENVEEIDISLGDEEPTLKALYNLVFQKYMQAHFNQLSDQELSELTGKVNEDDNTALKEHLTDIKITENVKEEFLADASFKAIGQAAKEHLEQRKNEIKPVTEKKDEINQKLTELNNEFNTFKTQEEINQKITAIQKLIEEQNQRIESVQQLPYFEHDNKLQEKVKEAKEAIKQNEQAIEEIKEKQKKLQEIVEGLQEAKKEFIEVTKKRNQLLDDVKQFKKSDTAVADERRQIDEQLTTALDKMKKEKRKAQENALNGSEIYTKNFQEAKKALERVASRKFKTKIEKEASNVNILMQVEGTLSNFTDTVVTKKEDAVNQEPNRTVDTDRTTIQQENNTTARYKGIRLSEGQYIQSKATFDSGKVGVIAQDYKNRVTDHSKQDELSDQEKNQVAFKMAKMLLANYDPAKGPVIISGKDKDMADKVFASLLLIKQNSPEEFKDLKIESRVPGCTGPNRLKDLVHGGFIKRHLGSGGQGELLQKSEREQTATELQRLKASLAVLKTKPELGGPLKKEDSLELGEKNYITRGPKQ